MLFPFLIWVFLFVLCMKYFMLFIICFLSPETTEFSLSGLYERLKCHFENFESTCYAILEKQDYEK